MYTVHISVNKKHFNSVCKQLAKLQVTFNFDTVEQTFTFEQQTFECALNGDGGEYYVEGFFDNAAQAQRFVTLANTVKTPSTSNYYCALAR